MEEFVENSVGHILWEFTPICRYCKKPLALSAFSLNPDFCDQADTLVLDICCTNCTNSGRVHFTYPEIEFVSIAGNFDFRKPKEGENKHLTNEDVARAIEEIEKMLH